MTRQTASSVLPLRINTKYMKWRSNFPHLCWAKHWLNFCFCASKKTVSHICDARKSRNQRRPSFFLKDEFQCFKYVVLLADEARMESATNESIKKRSIPSNKKLILEARRKIAVVSVLKEVKNIVQTFSFQCSLYAHEDRAYSLSRFCPIFPSIFLPTGESPPISPVPKKSKLKAQHGVKVWTEVWQKEWHNWSSQCFTFVPKTME